MAPVSVNDDSGHGDGTCGKPVEQVVESFERNVRLSSSKSKRSVEPTDESGERSWPKWALGLMFVLMLIQITGSFLPSSKGTQSTKVAGNLIIPNRNFNHVVGHARAKTRIRPYLDTILRRLEDEELYIPLFLLNGPRGTGKRLFSQAVANEVRGVMLFFNLHELSGMSPETAKERARGFHTLLTNSLKSYSGTPIILHLEAGSGSLGQSQPTLENEISSMYSLSATKKPYGSEDEKGAATEILFQLLSDVSNLQDAAHLIITFVSADSPVSTEVFNGDNRIVKLNFRYPTTLERTSIIIDKLKDSVPNEEDRQTLAEQFANQTHGLNGGHLSKICKEAILKAHVNRKEVGSQQLQEAAEELEEEEEVHRLLPWERQVVAFHEAGHVVSAWHSAESEDVTEVSIVPGEDGALGCTKYATAGKLLHTDDMLLTKMMIALAGQMAEKEFFGSLTTGGRDDLYKMTKIAYMRVANFGLDDGFKASFGGQTSLLRTYGERVAETIDARAFELIEKLIKRTEDMVQRHFRTIGKVATSLLQNDILSHEDIQKLIGPRPSSECIQWPCRLTPRITTKDPTLKQVQEILIPS